MTGIILAGGRSRRLGRDKALERVGDKILLERAVTALAQVADEVLVVGRSPLLGTRDWPLTPKTRFLEDLEPGRGPLGGLYTGLLAVRGPYAWAVGCDMPFLDPALLARLMELASGYDAVAPVLDGQAQPLHAVYATACAPVAAALLRGSHPGLHALLDRIQVRYVAEAELGNVARWRRSCFSVNTPEELERAWAQEEDYPVQP